MAKRSRREPFRTRQGGRWVGLACLVILVFFGLISHLGIEIAAAAAFAAGVIGALSFRFLRRAPRVTRGAIVTADGCRFIPLDTDEIDAAIEAGQREQAPPGALPPVLPVFCAPAISEPAEPEAGSGPESTPAAPAWPGPAKLRLAGRPSGGAATAAPRPAAPPAATAARSSGSCPATSAPRSQPVAPDDDEEAAHKRVCPECGSELRQRIAFDGPSAGKFVWGCRGFPKCRYVASPDAEPAEQACPDTAGVGH